MVEYLKQQAGIVEISLGHSIFDGHHVLVGKAHGRPRQEKIDGASA
jgi:hypothetical protein